jgi:ATP-dependent helicase/nuclease subunit A
MNLVSHSKITGFLASHAAYRMAKADSLGKLYREQPFVMAIEADRIVEEIPKNTEKVLIQGIIDVFFHETDEKTAEEYVVVLDYKTDAVASGEELMNRYRVQLEYYAEALQKLTQMSVREKMIYSFFQEKELRL